MGYCKTHKLVVYFISVIVMLMVPTGIPAETETARSDIERSAAVCLGDGGDEELLATDVAKKSLEASFPNNPS